MDFIKNTVKRGEPRGKIKKIKWNEATTERWDAEKDVKGISKQNQHSYKKKGEKEKWK